MLGEFATPSLRYLAPFSSLQRPGCSSCQPSQLNRTISPPQLTAAVIRKIAGPTLTGFTQWGNFSFSQAPSSPGSSAHLVTRNMSSSPPREKLADEKIISDRSETAPMTSSNNKLPARGWGREGKMVCGLKKKNG